MLGGISIQGCELTRILRLTPLAVATTRYGKRKRLSPTEWNTSWNSCMICRASISCLTSSPTLKMEACHTPWLDSCDEREARARGREEGREGGRGREVEGGKEGGVVH